MYRLMLLGLVRKRVGERGGGEEKERGEKSKERERKRGGKENISEGK